MKTKPFLLATAGSTVDGRTIDDKMLDQMASSYDPATYGARLNIEHIRGISPDKPFCAYGDVIALSIGETTVNFNGKPEKRKALFGTFDVTDDAKKINDAGQKLYPSIEILDNFGGKGFAYLAGVALTDSPASIATERLKFNRSLPGSITLTGDAALALEADETTPEAQADATIGVIAGFFSKLGDKMGLNTQAAPAGTAPAPEPAATPSFDPAQFAKDLGETITAAFTKQNEGIAAQFATITADVAALKTTVEATPAATFKARPLALGGDGAAVTDC